MVTQPLSDAEWLALTTPDDSEEAPWMTMPEYQWRAIALLMSILRRYIAEHNLPWYIAAELTVSTPRHIRPGARVLNLGPDLLMAEADKHERQSWNVTVEGKPPAFVLEIVTEESWTRDSEEKDILYDWLGVHEYAIFAPYRKDTAKLFGYQRDARGRWGTWRPDRRGMLRSQALGGLRLCLEGEGVLRLRDTSGRLLLSDQEAAEQERLRAEQERLRAEQERLHAEQERLRAEAAEDEVARLRAEVARLRPGGGSS